MAFTQTQLDAIEAAIATGELTVTFASGRSVTYRSMSDLIQARDVIKQSISGSSTTRSTVASYSKE